MTYKLPAVGLIQGVGLSAAILLGLSLATSAEETGSLSLNEADHDCTSHPLSIDLSVHDVRRTRGVITVDLHNDDPDGWINKRGRVDRVRADAKEGITRICIPVERSGLYAIALYHDEDADFEFDKNFLGIPSEPYGISNDPRIGFSAPPHEKAAFDVQGPATPVTVTLRGN